MTTETTQTFQTKREIQIEKLNGLKDGEKSVAGAVKLLTNLRKTMYGYGTEDHTRYDDKIDELNEELHIAKKDLMDASAKADDLRLREAVIKAKQEYDGTKLGIDIKRHQVETQNQQELEGTRLGIDVAKHREMVLQQQRQQATQKFTKKPTGKEPA